MKSTDVPIFMRTAALHLELAAKLLREVAETLPLVQSYIMPGGTPPYDAAGGPWQGDQQLGRISPYTCAPLIDTVTVIPDNSKHGP